MKPRLAVAMLIAFAIALVACDSSPRIQGLVTDDFDEPLVDVDVSIVNTELRTRTDRSGRYALTYVPGRFEVWFAKEGYEPTSISLEFSTRETVPVRTQVLASKKARREVIAAFQKTINSLHGRYMEHYRAKNLLTARIEKELDDARATFIENIGKAKLGPALMRHVMKHPAGSTFGMVLPAYLKMGFDRLPEADDLEKAVELPEEVRTYFRRARECDETIWDGKIGIDDPKFLEASELCYLPFSGMALQVAIVLLGESVDLSSDMGSVRDIRKRVADKRVGR
jgi:hypothetical protein